uniref:Fucosyltransferase n=2 Tax=Timema TaxID=61471 RepID=A0A7R9NYZ6_9NEOP|nr:unnamed protein product [Timema bartmani]CAD7461304.1 unnamed protein product [Timema tahoe]
MVPRVSLRRTFFYLVCAVPLVFLALTLTQHQDQWARSLLAGDAGAPSPPLNKLTRPADRDAAEAESTPELRRSQGVASAAALPEEDPGDRGNEGGEVEEQEEEEEGKPWYMSGGTRRSSSSRRLLGLWPAEEPGSDRIAQQLMYVPENYDPEKQVHLKKILLYNGLGSWSPLKQGRESFLQSQCPVDTCTISTNKAEAQDADAILFKDHFVNPGHLRPGNQVWILYFLECPYHTQHVKHNDVFNWTATYRRDSDLVAPYEKWAYYNDKVVENPHGLDRNYAANKTKKVAWFVSNCGARNKRLQYAHELQKHIQVDIYGSCGTKKCPRSSQGKCFDMLDKDYKFYLAFENSNCKDYITEKFYVNGLQRNVLPIVMGARPEDYARSAPKHSYIHVDEFESPKHLAEYLHQLDRDDDLYNNYFRWKGTGEFINTYFFCRMCALLHADIPVKWYRDVNDWWRGPGTCTAVSWRKPKLSEPIR